MVSPLSTITGFTIFLNPYDLPSTSLFSVSPRQSMLLVCHPPDILTIIRSVAWMVGSIPTADTTGRVGIGTSMPQPWQYPVVYHATKNPCWPLPLTHRSLVCALNKRPLPAFIRHGLYYYRSVSTPPTRLKTIFLSSLRRVKQCFLQPPMKILVNGLEKPGVVHLLASSLFIAVT